MKKILTFLIVIMCLKTFGQNPVVLKPRPGNPMQVPVTKPAMNNIPGNKGPISQMPQIRIDEQRKFMDILKKDAAKKASLLNATLTEVSLRLSSPEHGCQDIRSGINDIFEEKKFVLYAGSKGTIVEANSFKLFSADDQIAIYQFSPMKATTYKELIDQSISFNMDLTKPSRCGTYGLSYRDLHFDFIFSDGTRIWGRSPGVNFYKPQESGPSAGEVHVARYLQPDVFPDLDK